MILDKQPVGVPWPGAPYLLRHGIMPGAVVQKAFDFPLQMAWPQTAGSV